MLNSNQFSFRYQIDHWGHDGVHSNGRGHISAGLGELSRDYRDQGQIIGIRNNVLLALSGYYLCSSLTGLLSLKMSN